METELVNDEDGVDKVEDMVVVEVVDDVVTTALAPEVGVLEEEVLVAVVVDVVVTTATTSNEATTDKAESEPRELVGGLLELSLPTALNWPFF